MRILSFDIEISDIFEHEQGEMDKYAPFHISVAATVPCDDKAFVWYSEEDGHPALNATPERIHQLLEYLKIKQEEGYMVCAWNGLGFDMRWIGYHAKDVPLAAEVALDIYDPMFQFFNMAGFPISLANTAKGLGIKQEKALAGSDAPKEWCAGNYEKVMRYVVEDCQMTNSIVEEILKTKQIRWVTAKGKTNTKAMPRLLPVREIIGMRGPDQSWMDKPIPKEKFYAWIEEVKKDG